MILTGSTSLLNPSFYYRLKSGHRSYNIRHQVQVFIIHTHEQSIYHCPLDSPRQFRGTLADINTANIVPIDPNSQNSELFYLCELSSIHLRQEFSTKNNLKISSYSARGWHPLMGKIYHQYTIMQSFPY